MKKPIKVTYDNGITITFPDVPSGPDGDGKQNDTLLKFAREVAAEARRMEKKG